MSNSDVAGDAQQRHEPVNRNANSEENTVRPEAHRRLILAIETSCDETSVAIVENGTKILSNVVSSQIETHRRFGGVVPEVASRKHVESITWIIEEALDKADVRPGQLSAIAVTEGPGLIGALLVGVVAAKTLAYALDLPLIGVHHIAGHIYANQLVHELRYPLVSLVVSGGHTELVYVEKEGSFRIIGQTRDDAAGEAYDKVARALKLPYPGGPHIDRLAHEAEEALPLPRAWLEPESYDFSFSGLKSAVLAALNQAGMKGLPIDARAVAKGFQDSVVEVLVEKSLRAVQEYGAKQLLLAGGVAANKGLRQQLADRCASAGVPLIAPPLSLCTDNAAMIAAAAHLKLERGQLSSLELKADPALDLEAWSV
ncbi:tRNA (adenosine(37)-N6)-threonylcarbamoyltransferase complex transferase subunit TsaD [Paenibacillus xerothermodurans]|uniref:tRNA N6-adenosine threonylcarbamoyltransferase n=1 Tax=Paenibacillus xerothermodurans TaxID=1977292 RepID=A0A2W1NKP3_PAEXE|nr:tRNA (adenosine(37)-N6)-threonylcarbamoyltransferase complex transferase subunit TsaD [Paenibacillus xerothermodurans]PZE19613.1 tRNA (adenosine(37)-N6)-threonylcarbamoyltransferase complex transferase subunit TsaD [Paenibacillus xerothermodurans]